MTEYSSDASFNGYAHIDAAANWAAVIAGTGAYGATLTTETVWNTGVDQATAPYVVDQFFMAFDTSEIPAEATISAATFYWGLNNNAAHPIVELYAYDFGAALDGTDYRTGGSAGWLDTAYDAGSRVAYYEVTGSDAEPVTFTTNNTPMFAAIVKGGTTRFVAVTSNMRGDAYAGPLRCQWCTIYHAQASVRPHLDVTYNIPDPPTVTTAAISAITSSTATGGGTITDEGGSAVSAYGVCWNTTGTPTTADSHTHDE